MRIEPAHRVIEVGNILYLPCLQRTVGATEAMYLLARYVFEELGYRRYEWKCDALNAPSRRAALRLGFTFEGIFRQHMIVKEKNRDTAWYSMLDTEWQERKRAFERWLDAANFDAARPAEDSLVVHTTFLAECITQHRPHVEQPVIGASRSRASRHPKGRIERIHREHRLLCE